MSAPPVVEPFTAPWLKTVSFGDTLKIVGFGLGAAVMFTNLKADVAHETEMRRLLEQRTAEMVAEIRVAQKDNSAHSESRFAENSARDRDLMQELKSRMDRLEGKIDQMLQNGMGYRNDRQLK